MVSAKMTELEQLLEFANEPIYNAKAVTMQTGVTQATLRAGDRRYSLWRPSRSLGAHRLYSDRDIASIKWLRQQIDQGLTISRAAALLQRMLDTGEAPALITDAPTTATAARPIEAVITDLYHAVIEYDEATADEILSEAYALYPVEHVCTHVIESVLRQLGEQWSDGTIQVATEHFASNYLRHKLIALIDTGVATRPGLIVTGCAPTELHEMGTLLMSIFLRRRGWHVLYLGQSVPLHDLSAALRDIKANVLVIAATMRTSIGKLKGIQEVLDTLEPGRRPVFAFGGLAFNQHPELRSDMPGTFLGETIEAGVEVVERLMAHPAK